MVFNRILVSGLACFWLGLAHAAPVIEIDVDPTTPGTQSTTTVTTGDVFSVDVLISSVEETDPLNGFQLTALFDAIVVNALDVTDGGFLPSPLVTLFDIDNAAGTVEFAEASLGVVSAFGAGVLAQIDFQATSTGATSLDLSDVLLSGPFGVAIDIAAISGATVNVTADGIVAEPSVSALLGFGALGLMISINSGKTNRRRKGLPKKVIPHKQVGPCLHIGAASSRVKVFCKRGNASSTRESQL